MKGKYLLVALVMVGIVIGYVGYTLYAPSGTVPTPTPTPTPTSPATAKFTGYEWAFHMLLEKRDDGYGNVTGELIIGGELDGKLPVTLRLSYVGNRLEEVENLKLNMGFAVWFWEYTTEPPHPLPVGDIIWRTLSLKSGDSFTYYNSTHDIKHLKTPMMVVYCKIESLQIDFADGSTWNYSYSRPANIPPFWYSAWEKYPPSAISVLLSEINGKRETNTFILIIGREEAKPRPAIILDIPSKTVTVKKGGSVTLPVTIHSCVDQPIKVRLILWSSMDHLPVGMDWEAEGWIALQPYESVQTWVTITAFTVKHPAEYSIIITAEMQELVEGYCGMSIMFSLAVVEES